jgi:hypothetical protein
MDHPKNQTTPILVSVALFDALGAPRTGEAETTTLKILCEDNGYLLDPADGEFKSSVASPYFPLEAMLNRDCEYFAWIDASTWRRGTYKAIFTAAETESTIPTTPPQTVTMPAAIYESSFSVGMRPYRALETAGNYDGTTLRISAWVTEDGVTQTDYTALRNVKLLGTSGAVVLNLADATTQTDGIFSLSIAVSLHKGTNYILSADVEAPAPAGRDPYQWNLRVGMARL